MRLTSEEQSMLAGERGKATRKALEILVALGTIYGAEQMVPVTSVQVAGVSYDNLGEAGLQYLTEMAEGGGGAQVLSTLNPAGMDIENPGSLGIDPVFAEKQGEVIAAFARMNIQTTCTCTPYLAGNVPGYGDHIAWAESSAVCYANSVLGARTNREGGPSALAAALTGRTADYGYHKDQNRSPDLGIEVDTPVSGSAGFGALGKAIGDKLQEANKRLPYICGIEAVSLEELKAFCASLATYGGTAMFHMETITPEAAMVQLSEETLLISAADLEAAAQQMSDTGPEDADFFSLGCPHLSINEIAHLAELLAGKRVRGEFWITTARPTRQLADQLGYSQIIEASGAKFATDTCCVVAPIRGRFKAMVTDSAKACYYAASKNRFRTVILPFDEVVKAAIRE